MELLKANWAMGMGLVLLYKKPERHFLAPVQCENTVRRHCLWKTLDLTAAKSGLPSLQIHKKHISDAVNQFSLWYFLKAS